jgi:hypothetical protein
MRVYSETVRSALAELADANYQQRVWTGGAADEMSSLMSASSDCSVTAASISRWSVASRCMGQTSMARSADLTS